MTALYKIVQDDHPPLPDGTSQALRDFLLQCFKKQAQVWYPVRHLSRVHVILSCIYSYLYVPYFFCFLIVPSVMAFVYFPSVNFGQHIYVFLVLVILY